MKLDLPTRRAKTRIFVSPGGRPMSLALPIVTDDPDMIRRLKRRGLVEVKTYRKTTEPTGSPTAARGGEQSWQ